VQYEAGERNRFHFEEFQGDEENQQLLPEIQKNLEGVQAQAPLEYFSRDEQLACWLNLYNVTMKNEIAKVYPERKLKKLLTGKKSILEKKLLTPAQTCSAAWPTMPPNSSIPIVGLTQG
jgi:hypothetical protein